MYTGGVKHAIFASRRDDDDDDDDEASPAPARMVMPARSKSMASAVQAPPDKRESQGSKAGAACTNYQIDMTAARFGDCKCGFSKLEHNLTPPSGGKPGVPAAPKPVAPVAVAPPKPAPQPLQRAATAPAVKSTHSTPAAQPKLSAPAALTDSHVTQTAASDAPKPVPQPSAPPPASFQGFQPVKMGSVHDRTKSFGSVATNPPSTCSSISASLPDKPASVVRPAVPPPAPATAKATPAPPKPEAATTPSKPPVRPTPPPTTQEEDNGERTPTGACDNYQIDMTAATFGACKCGFPKAAHCSSNLSRGASFKSTLPLGRSRRGLPPSPTSR